MPDHLKVEQPFIWVLLVSFLSGWGSITDKHKNKCKVFFPNSQRRIASSGIEPGVSNLSITNALLTE